MMAKVVLFLSEQWILISILLVLVFLFIQNESRRGGASISIHQLTALINQKDALVLDIRDAGDYKAGHIIDALHVPYSKLKDRLKELDKYQQRPIVVVDKMGQHSGAAGKQLSEAGFDVSRLEGGMSEWQGSKLPMIKG